MNFERSLAYTSINVGRILHELNSTPNPHLVTRTTGRDVRGIIEEKIRDLETLGLSHIDFSEIEVMDFSCADEVVAKLLAQYVDPNRSQEIFFVLRDLSPSHIEPLSEVLDSQGILAVNQDSLGSLQLLGSVSPEESKAWDFIEMKRVVTKTEIDKVFSGEDEVDWKRLVHQRVVFEEIKSDRYYSLGSLIQDSP